MKQSNTIAVIGAGNGGQAFAGYLGANGYNVRIYDRSSEKVDLLNIDKEIKLVGALQLTGKIEFASTDLKSVITGAQIIMVVTTATAHSSLATQMASSLSEGQIIVLNPGRTCGALEFHNALEKVGIDKKVYVAEAQTLVYACRIVETGTVNIIGVKDRVLISAYPASDTVHVLNVVKPIYPCFYAAKNVLQTSFENVGAMFHPTVVLFNEAAIERGESFFFYRDMTDGLASIIEEADRERLAVAAAYGVSPISAFDWVSYAYNGVEGNSLCERMQNNPAYYEIIAPKTIECRQITEDIPTGIIPLAELGKAAGVPTPLFDSLITICSILHNRDYMSEGRTLKRLGLDGLSVQEIINKIQ
ncbi:MAG: NAD/NADP octopine/nopaline dehydrogenase family protein [Muribaculaceae bacterium]|nr:NAD/NADP octopine/nopaline dehydrogenase family protein [Muribaculaceae bacterium]